MKSINRFRRLLFPCLALALVFVVIATTKHGIPQVKAQTVSTRDVFVFHCALIPGQPLDTSNLGSFNTTFTNSNGNFVQVSDCAQVMRDALNAGYQLKTALALPNGGPGGTGATEYVFIKNDQ